MYRHVFIQCARVITELFTEKTLENDQRVVFVKRLAAQPECYFI